MVYLRTLEEKDAEGMLEWMHDPEMQKYFRRPMMQTSPDDVLKFIKENQFQIETVKEEVLDGRRSYIHFAVADEYNNYLGTVSLKNIDLISQNAEYAISMRATVHGTGAAFNATVQLLEFVFNEICLEKIYLNVLQNNKRAIHFYKKAGFSYEGTARKHVKVGFGKNAELKTLEWYSMLRNEFECKFMIREKRDMEERINDNRVKKIV